MEIVVESFDDFEKLTQSKDFRIAQALYDAVIKNLNNKKRSIYFISVAVLEEGMVYDLSVERKNIAISLDEIMPLFIEKEMYEECAIMKKIIDKNKPNLLS